MKYLLSVIIPFFNAEKHLKKTVESVLKQRNKDTEIILVDDCSSDRSKKITEILYPYQPSSKNYKLWKKYYSGASGLLGIVIKSKSKNSVYSFVNSLELFGIGYSWGGYSSLAVYNDPVEMGDRRFFKIEKNNHLIRLHIGLEDTNDLINDLKNALRKVK